MRTLFASLMIIVYAVLLVSEIDSFLIRNQLPWQKLQQSYLFMKTRDEEQFSLFRTASLGIWKGVQTGYDPADDMVEDYMYTEVSYKESGNEVVHVNGIVAGEIRADCETSYDSERLQSKEVGRYTVGKLPNIKSCHNCLLRGPAPTRRGMSTELLLYQPDTEGDMRLRVLLAYKPIDFQEIQGVGPVPSALGLTDIIIVRERREKRPLKLDEGPDQMWRPSEPNRACGPFAAKYSYSATSLVEKHPVPTQGNGLKPLSLAMPRSESGHEEGWGEVYERSFPGGITIEAGSVVYAGLETRYRVLWQPSSIDKRAYCAEVAFRALENVLVDGDAVRVSPPQVLDFTVME